MYIDENKSLSLAKYLSNYDYVFLDTCSLMEDSFPSFMDTLVASNEYWKEGLHVVVLKECVKELKKHKRNKDKDKYNARIAAIRALKILRHDRWHGKTLEIVRNTTKGNFADHAITNKAVELRIDHKILIITQDKILTNDLLKLNNFNSQRGKPLHVSKIASNGTLVRADNNFVAENRNNNNLKEKTKSNDDIDNVLSLDKKLMSNINNPNYPNEKKLNDINNYLSLLSKISVAQKNNLHLAFDEKRLLKEKAKIVNSNTKKANKTIAKKEIKNNKHIKKEKTNLINADDKKLKPSSNVPTKIKEKDNIVATSEKQGIAILPKNVSLFVGEPLKKEKRVVIKKSNKNASTKKSNKVDNKALNEVINSETRLNSNISNPNYPIDSKISDIDNHLVLLKSVSKNEKEKLKLSSSELLKRKKELLVIKKRNEVKK